MRSFLAKFHTERGQILVMAALLITVLLGVVGLAVEEPDLLSHLDLEGVVARERSDLAVRNTNDGFSSEILSAE